MKAWALTYTKKQTGFTIVELLIVVVVIAILAAITIVAYTGIQNRSKESALATSTTQVGKKLEVFKIDNGDTYPSVATFSAATGVSNTAATTYTYLTTADNRGYCASAHDSGNPAISFAVTPTMPATKSEICATNLVTNPSFETNTSGLVWNTGGLGGGATGSGSNALTGGYVDSRTARYTLATAGTVTSLGPYTLVTGLNGTTSYQLSAWVRSSKPLPYIIRAELRNSSSTSIGNLTSSAVTLAPDTWTRVSMTVPPTANLDRITFCVYSTGTVAVVAGDYTEVDGMMLTSAPAQTSYDQSGTSNWYWSGTPHASTSFGPAQVQ
ncbi:MAG: prepilin-type N-terminal cleavage/methylation domain-containing protein [Candidatus Saccharimonadota bacterium]